MFWYTTRVCGFLFAAQNLISQIRWVSLLPEWNKDWSPGCIPNLQVPDECGPETQGSQVLIKINMYHKVVFCISRMHPVSPGCILYLRNVSCISRVYPLSSGCILYLQDVSCISKMYPVYLGCILYHQVVSCISRLYAVYISRLYLVSPGCILFNQFVSCISRLSPVYPGISRL